MSSISLSLGPLVQELTHEQFYELCMVNKEIAMERSPTGELIIMPPLVVRVEKKKQTTLLI